jgi:hypothetical protein
MLVGHGRPLGGPYRSGGSGGAGDKRAPISVDELNSIIKRALWNYNNMKSSHAVYFYGILTDLEKLQVEIGMGPTSLPPGREPGPAPAALYAIDMLLATAREFRNRGHLDQARTCLLSGCVEFASDYQALGYGPNEARVFDQLFAVAGELTGMGDAESAGKTLKILLNYRSIPDQSDQNISRIAIAMAKIGKMDEGIGILFKKKPGGHMPLHLGKPRPSEISAGETNRFYYLAKEWPDFYRENQETLNAQALQAVRKGIGSWREQGIDTNGVESYELPVIETLMGYSPLAALVTYQRILLPLVNREKPINPAYALRPIVEAIEEVSPEAAEAFPSTPSMLILYMTGVANFVRTILVEKGINPQEGLWYEIPILIRAFPDPQFASAMKAFEELYVAYQDSPRDLNPKAMRQILPLLPRDKFEAALRSMAVMVKTGIDPQTRLDELVR